MRFKFRKSIDEV